MFIRLFSASGLMTACLASSLHAMGPDGFSTGPLIDGYGPVASVDTTMPIPDGSVFRVSFDLVDEAEAGSLNRNLVSAARFKVFPRCRRRQGIARKC